MDFQQLKSFQKVAECHSLTKAADTLFLSVSALKQQMDSLETEVGVLLFHRSPKGVTLTAAGEYFLEKSRELTAMEADILWETRNISSANGSTVYIGFRHMKITDYLYPEFLVSFLEEHPGTDVSLVDMNQNSYMNIDLLMCDYIGDTEFDVSYPLRQIPVQCILNTNHPLSSRESLDLGDLQAYGLIVPPIPILKNLQPELAKKLQELRITFKESLLNKEIIYLNLLTSDQILLTFGDERYLKNVLVQIPLKGYFIDYCVRTRKEIKKPIVRDYLDGMLRFYREHR